MKKLLNLKKLFFLLKIRLISIITKDSMNGKTQKFKKVKKSMRFGLLLNIINAGSNKVDNNVKYLFFIINCLVIIIFYEYIRL